MNWEFSIFGNMDWFRVWAVAFHDPKEQLETFLRFSPSGGTYSCKVESSHVLFSAAPGTIHVRQRGQLLSGDGHSYYVEVIYVDLAEGHVRISGNATRTLYL